MKVTVLGCGGSGGVPLAGRAPGGFWGECDPSNPKNRRRRVSILAEQGDTTVLVDASPDLRLQMLDNDIIHLDAVLFTHAHGDHCHGIDDLRYMTFARGGPIPAHMDQTTRALLTRRFDYAFTSSHDPESLYQPLLDDRTVEGPFEVGELAITPFVQGHGPETTLGYRFDPVGRVDTAGPVGSLAYSTDLVSVDGAAFDALEGVRVWIVDCLRFEPHPTHAHFDLVMDWVARVRPERTVLTHMNHQVDYGEIAARCPPGVEPAYDGLVIEVEA